MLVTNTHPLNLARQLSQEDIIRIENSQIIRGKRRTESTFCGIPFHPFQNKYRKEINTLFENRLVSSQTKMENWIHQLQKDHPELSHYLEEQLAADNERMNSFFAHAKNNRKTVSQFKNLFNALEGRYEQIFQACHAVLKGNYAQLHKLRAEMTLHAAASTQTPEFNKALEQINFISDYVIKDLNKDLLNPLEPLIQEISTASPELAQYLHEKNRVVIQKKLEEVFKNTTSLEVLETELNQLNEWVKLSYEKISQAFLALQQVDKSCKLVDRAIEVGVQDAKKESPHMLIAREGLKKLISQCDALDQEIGQLSVEISEKEKQGEDATVLKTQHNQLNETAEQIKTIANEAVFLTLGKKQNLTGFITTFFHEKALKQILGDGSLRERKGKTPYNLAVKSAEHFKDLKKEFETYWSEFSAMTSTTSTTTDDESVPLFFKDFVKDEFYYLQFKNLTGKDPSDPHHLTYEETKELLPALLNKSVLSILTPDEIKGRFGRYLSFLYYCNAFNQAPILLSQLSPVDQKLRHSTHNGAGSGLSSNNGSGILTSEDMVKKAQEAHLHPGFIHFSIPGCWSAQTLEYYRGEDIVLPRPHIKAAGERVELAFSKKGFYNFISRAHLFPQLRCVNQRHSTFPYHSNLRRVEEKVSTLPPVYERGSDHRIFFFYRRSRGELIRYKG